MAEDRDGDIWIGTQDGGLSQFVRETGLFVRWKHDPKDSRSLSDNQVTAVYVDRGNTVWVGTRRGLNQLDREKQQFIRHAYDPATGSLDLSDSHVNAIVEDQDGILFIGTESGGLNRLDSSTKRFLNLKASDGGGLSHPASNRIVSLAVDRLNRIWIAYGIEKISIFDKNTV